MSILLWLREKKMNFDEGGKALKDETDTKAILDQVSKIHESQEIVFSNEYESFLHGYFDTLIHILRRTPCQFVNNEQNKIRYRILAFLWRLHHGESIFPYVTRLLDISSEILQKDNERNAYLAMRIIFDIHKNHRTNDEIKTALETKLPIFLKFVQDAYDCFPQTAEKLLAEEEAAIQLKKEKKNRVGNPMNEPSSNDPSNISNNKRDEEEEGPNRHILPSSCSFKIVTECPLIVMFLSQLYDTAKPYLEVLVPAMLKTVTYKYQGSSSTISDSISEMQGDVNKDSSNATNASDAMEVDVEKETKIGEVVAHDVKPLVSESEV